MTEDRAPYTTSRPEPTLLATLPNAITDDAKATLADAGVIVVECANPAALRFLRPSADVSTSDMLLAAMRALMADSTDRAKVRFAVEISNMVERAARARDE